MTLSVAHFLPHPKDLRTFIIFPNPVHESLPFLFQKVIVYLDILLMVPVWEKPLRRWLEVTRFQRSKPSKQASKQVVLPQLFRGQMSTKVNSLVLTAQQQQKI